MSCEVNTATHVFACYCTGPMAEGFKAANICKLYLKQLAATISDATTSKETTPGNCGGQLCVKN